MSVASRLGSERLTAAEQRAVPGQRPTDGLRSAADGVGADSFKHGYPPPRLSAGSKTTAYCGAPIVVAGEYSEQPPGDACPLCALAWQTRRQRRRFWF